MKLPTKGVPVRDTLDTDIYRLKVEDFKEDTDAKKKTFVLRTRAQAPDVWAGTSTFTRYCIGTEKDPTGSDPEQLRKNGFFKDLVKLLHACGFDTDAEDFDTDTSNPTGREFVTHAIQKVEPATRKRKGADGRVTEEPNEYAGNIRVNFARYWRVDDPRAPKPGSIGAKTRPASPAAPIAQPVTPTGDTVVE